MKRLHASGLIVLVCLSASSANGTEARKRTVEDLKRAEKQRQAEQERQAEEAARQAEALKQQAEAELKEVQRKKEELEQQQRQAEQQLQAAQEEKKPTGPEPKLNIPIRYFVYTALFSGLGYATGFLSRGPERDLRDPAKHPTQDKTLSLYRQARYGGLISKGFYSLSGAMGAFAAYKTQSAVREYLTAKAQQSVALQREKDQRLAEAQSPEERQATEVSNALLLPPEPLATELLVTAPEPPPLQAGFFLSPAGDASVSLSVSF